MQTFKGNLARTEIPQPEAKRDAAQAHPHHVRPRRTRMMLTARMKGLGTSSATVIVRDVSRTGLGATVQGRVPREGDDVAIRLSNGKELCGAVRWARGSKFGLLLNEELDVDGLGHSMRDRNGALGDTVGWVVDQRLQPAPQAPSKLRRL